MPEAETWRYRGQTIDRRTDRLPPGVHPGASRQQPLEAVAAVVRSLEWKQANGALRDMVCRGLLLMLDRAGEIELPPVRRQIRRPSPDGAATAGSRPDRHRAADDATGSIGPD